MLNKVDVSYGKNEKTLSHVQDLFVKKNYNQIISQPDYLSTVCQYLTVNEIFYSIPLISQFHLHYIHNIQQTKLLKQCLSYDFGDILNRFKINLDACNNHNNATNNNNNINNKHNNISYRMSRFYTDYKYLYECAVNAKCETSNRFNTAECDFTPLMKLEKNNAIQHWLKASKDIEIDLGNSLSTTMKLNNLNVHQMACLLLAPFNWKNKKEKKQYINSVLSLYFNKFSDNIEFVYVLSVSFTEIHLMHRLPAVQIADHNLNDDIFIKLGNVAILNQWWDYLMLFKKKYHFIIDKTANASDWMRFFGNLFIFIFGTTDCFNKRWMTYLYHHISDSDGKYYVPYFKDCKLLLNKIALFYLECNNMCPKNNNESNIVFVGNSHYGMVNKVMNCVLR